MSFSLGPKKPTYSYTYTPAVGKGQAERSSGLLLKRVGVVAVVALLAVGLGLFYMKMQAERRYAQDYMRALYTIKTGTDLSVKTCERISSDWKAKMDAGQNFVPRISADEEAKLNKVKEVTDRYMQKLNKPPKKYAGNKEKLADLYGIYTKSNALALAPSGTITSFESAAAKSQSDFNTSITALKDSMPDVLSKEFKIAQKKYKGLQNI
jgi:hypothetical protein